MRDSITQVSLISDSRMAAEVTDSKWLRVMVYDALIGHVDMVHVLCST